MTRFTLSGPVVTAGRMCQTRTLVHAVAEAAENVV